MITVFLAVKDDSKKVHYREKIKGYMDQAEQIKDHVNKLKEGWLSNNETRGFQTGLREPTGGCKGLWKKLGEKLF